MVKKDRISNKKIVVLTFARKGSLSLVLVILGDQTVLIIAGLAMFAFVNLCY